MKKLFIATAMAAVLTPDFINASPKLLFVVS